MSKLFESYERTYSKLPVYDMHMHYGPFSGIELPWTSAKEMIPAMDKAGVRAGFLSSHHALMLSKGGNGISLKVALENPGRIFAYLVVNPYDMEEFDKDLAEFQKHPEVWIGFKFHGGSHPVDLLESPVSRKALAIADKMHAIVLLHTWGGTGAASNADKVEPAIAKYKNAFFILGHSCHGSWDKAGELLRKYKNAYADIVAVPDEKGDLEKLVAASGKSADKILFGTDAPWFDFHYYIGSILGADIDEKTKASIISKGAEKLFAKALKGRLKKILQ